MNSRLSGPADFDMVTTPACMLGPGITEVAAGIEKLVDRILSMA